jgi:hypothetical protein
MNPGFEDLIALECYIMHTFRISFQSLAVILPTTRFNIQKFHMVINIAFVCSVRISEQTAIFSLYNINRLVFITEVECLQHGTD